MPLPSNSTWWRTRTGRSTTWARRTACSPRRATGPRRGDAGEVAVDERRAIGVVLYKLGRPAEALAVLEEYCPPFPGCDLYHPQRWQASPALRALIDYLLRIRQAR